MFAPVREDLDLSNITPSGDVFKSCSKDEGYAYRIYGELDELTDMKDSRIYVELKNENDTIIYEAFPIHEDKLLETSGTKGYSMFIDAKLLVKGEYQVRVIVGDKSYKAENITI